MSKIVKRQGKVDKQDILMQAVEAAKFVDSWNSKKEDEYTPTSGFKWSENDTDKPARFAFKRPSNGHTMSAKRRQYERIYTHIRKRLYRNDKRKKNITQNDRLAVNTIQGYNGDIREAIRATGIVSPQRDSNVDLLIKLYPEYKDALTQIKQAHALLLSNVISMVRKDISRDDTELSRKVVKHIRTLNFENLIVRELTLPEGVAEDRHREIERKLIKRKENEFNISLASIKRITGECLASNRFDELSLGIALATGRRAIEVVYTGNFTKTRGKHNIKFTGQAKGSKIFDEAPNVIPMIVEADTVIEAVTRLRNTAFYKNILTAINDNPEINPNVLFNRRMANDLVAVIRAKFNNDGMVFHTSRVIATKTALKVIHEQRNNRPFDDGLFIATYTGHTSGGKVSLNDNRSYEHVHILVDAEDNIESRTLNKAEDAEDKPRDVQIMRDLIEALRADTLSTNKPFLKWYDKLIENISVYPFELTQRNIRQGYKYKDALLKIGGGHIATVKKFENPIIKDHIERYNNSNQ